MLCVRLACRTLHRIVLQEQLCTGGHRKGKGKGKGKHTHRIALVLPATPSLASVGVREVEHPEVFAAHGHARRCRRVSPSARVELAPPSERAVHQFVSVNSALLGARRARNGANFFVCVERRRCAV